MRRCVQRALAGGAVAGFAALVVVSGVAAQTAEEDLRRVLQEQHFAYWSKDVATFARVAGDEFYRIGQNGQFWTKAEHLASMQGDPTLPAPPSVHDEVQIRVYGQVAVVTLLDHRPGTPVPATRSTYAFVYRDGGWQMTALHQTAVRLR